MTGTDIFKYLRKWRYEILMTILVILCALLGLGWLSLFLCMIIAVIRLLSLIRKHVIVYRVLAVIAFVVMAVSIRVLVFEIYTIPSESMENTLFMKDRILVSKLNYGPRLPRSMAEVPWLNIYYLLTNGGDGNNDTFLGSHQRLAGFSRARRGDVLVFRKPDSQEEFLVKRCIGLPGDTILIRNEQTLVNGRQIDNVPATKFLYRACMKDLVLFRHYAETNHIPYNFDTDSATADRCVLLFLDQPEAQQFRKLNFVESLTAFQSTVAVFPYNENNQWHAWDYGPLVVPAKGMKLQLTPFNRMVYGAVITNELIHIQDGKTATGNIDALHSYEFQCNYYFVLGDNRDYSNDSRFIGFIPEANIEGKAVLDFYRHGVDTGPWYKQLFIGL